jgi:homeobox protein cut-like
MTTIGKITELGDSLINAALDRLEDELESRLDATGFAGTNPSSIGDVALSSDAIASAKACAKWWTELALAEKREDWTSAAMEMASAKEDGEARAKALGVVAKAAKKDASDPSAASQRALIKALGDEVNATRTRCEFAETAFMSTLNDLDDAPDPAESLTKSLAAAEALGALASEAATLRRELDAANRSLASAAADAAVAARERAELEALRESREREVDAAVATRVADAEKTVAELEVKLEAAAVAREKAEAALRRVLPSHTGSRTTASAR